jgi:hypothetical protein
VDAVGAVPTLALVTAPRRAFSPAIQIQNLRGGAIVVSDWDKPQVLGERSAIEATSFARSSLQSPLRSLEALAAATAPTPTPLLGENKPI